MIVAVILIVVAIIIAWIWFDFKLGTSVKRRNTFKKEYFLRQGHIDFYSEGHPFFNRLFSEIEQAQDHIHINFYIFRYDTLGKETAQRLIRKAQEGVKIRVLVDFIGSRCFPKKARKKLTAAGVTFAVAQKPCFPYFFYTLNQRNHRKITVIDGKVGFLGGFNIGDEYLGKTAKFGNWRDYHLAIKGDGVQDLGRLFLTDWQQATGEEVRGVRYFPELPKGEMAFRLFPTDGAFLEEHFLDAIQQAKTSIIIGSPYYIPGKKLQNALLYARKRGVSVELIFPMKKDHPLVHEAAVPYFAPLLRAGCHIFLYTQGFYHAKVMIIDRKICDIGTANFDRRSFIFNNEVNCLIHHQGFTDEVLSTLNEDFRRSKELTIEDIKSHSAVQRVKQGVATALSGLL